MGDRLTRREVQCVRLAGEGLANKEIARRLNLAPRTVGNHLSNAYAKLGVADRFEAAGRIARDYPEMSRFSPIPIPSPASTGPVAWTPGATPSDEDAVEVRVSAWPLPPPPRGVLRLVWILAVAAIAAVLVGGIVFMLTASLRLSAESAPANAVRSI